MKKLFTIIATITIFTTTNATAMTNPRGQFDTPIKAYDRGYTSGYTKGYSAGERHMKHEIAKAATIAGMAVIASVVIYQWGKNSNWTVSQNGVGYRF